MRVLLAIVLIVAGPPIIILALFLVAAAMGNPGEAVTWIAIGFLACVADVAFGLWLLDFKWPGPADWG